MNKGREDEEERIKVHSIHSRVKDPEHLIAKIIRKNRKIRINTVWRYRFVRCLKRDGVRLTMLLSIRIFKMIRF